MLQFNQRFNIDCVWKDIFFNFISEHNNLQRYVATYEILDMMCDGSSVCVVS